MLRCMATPGDAPLSPSANAGIRYLTGISVITAVVGASFVLLPIQVYAVFGWMVYGAEFPVSFGGEESAYVRLAHAVMGALMAGWFAFTAWFVRRILPRRFPGAWSAMVSAFLLWFGLDTTYSALCGYWPNAVLNVGFLVAFAPGFWLTRSLRTAVHPADAVP